METSPASRTVLADYGNVPSPTILPSSNVSCARSRRDPASRSRSDRAVRSDAIALEFGA
jgi:hypothetical protein